MAQKRATSETPKQQAADEAAIFQSYGCGAARFAGAPDALYERHLKFDNVVEPESSDMRERYEAAARAMRDILAERWLRTDETYRRENPKRVYLGWERRSQVPSEATFSRAFAEFAQGDLPDKMHAALIERSLGARIVGVIARDATEIEAPEKPDADGDS